MHALNILPSILMSGMSVYAENIPGDDFGSSSRIEPGTTSMFLLFINAFPLWINPSQKFLFADDLSSNITSLKEFKLL